MTLAQDPSRQAPSPGALLAAFMGALGNELADLLEGPAVTGWPAELRPALKELRQNYEVTAGLVYEASLPDRSHRPGLREALYASLATLSARELALVQALMKWRATWIAKWSEDSERAQRRTPFAGGGGGGGGGGCGDAQAL